MAKGNQSTGLGGKVYPKVEGLKRNVQLKTVLDKTVADRATFRRAHGGNNQELAPSGGLAQLVSDTTTQNISDANNILQLLPDTELAIQVLVSSILSPKDLVSTELGFRAGLNDVPAEATAPLVEVVRDYFTKVYNIEANLSTMLEDILFRKGSYPLMVLPETTLDSLINSSGQIGMEDLQSASLNREGNLSGSIGILGGGQGSESKPQFSLESFTNERYHQISDEQLFIKGVPDNIKNTVKVVDNFEILKMPSLAKKMRQDRLQNVLSYRGIGLEARSRKKKDEDIPDEEVKRSIYRHRSYAVQHIGSVASTNADTRPNVGNPLVMKLPPEAVIPVFTPSNPSDHIGYFLLLDQYGNPLSRVKEKDQYSALSNSLTSMGSGGGNNFQSQLLSNAGIARSGTNNRDMDAEEMVYIYGKIIEKDLVERLKNGLQGGDVEIASPQSIYRVMLARALEQKQTQLLYVPAEFVTYMAFDYNQFGVGASLLDTNKIIAGQRAILMFANTLASIKNSTGKTHLNIQLDPDDPSPSETVEFLLNEYAKNRRGQYPLGESNPVDIINYLQEAGVDIQVSGNTAYPETKVDIEDSNTNKTVVDNDLEERMRDQFFMSLGLSPETIDLSKNVEFATSVVSSNLLLAKRVINYQDKFLVCLQDLVRKYTIFSGNLQRDLEEAVNKIKSKLPKEYKNKHEEFITDFIYSIELTLPRPDTVTLENQMEAFRQYNEALEMALAAYFNEELMSFSELDDIEPEVRGTQAALTAYFQRQWLRDNNVLPELMDLVAVDDNDKAIIDLFEIQGTHLKAIGNAIVRFMTAQRKARAKREEKLNADMPEGEAPLDGTGTATSDDDFDNSFSPDEGGDDTTEEEETSDTDTDTDTDTTEEGGDDTDQTEEEDDDGIPPPP